MDYTSVYADFLKKKLNVKKPLSIVCDASNGATGILIKKVFEGVANLTVTTLNETVDGEFPAHGPNPMYETALKDVVPKIAETKADFGIVYDGDGDRAVFVDGKGRRVPSYVIALILFSHLPAPYIGDEHVYKSLQHINIVPIDNVIPSLVGTYNIKRALRVNEASAAAELSGHYYFKEFFHNDSALFATALVLNAVSQMQQTFTEYVETLPPFVLVNDDMPRKKEWKELEAGLEKAAGASVKVEKRDGITLEYGNGWVNIRPSNTEPLIRLAAGATTEQEARRLLDQAMKTVETA